MAERLVATVGLHGSASTWVFNVVRELMITHWGEVTALYADQPGELPSRFAGIQHGFVIKSHHGSAEIDAWLQSQNAKFILSVRDPRDACLSMVQRFGAPLRHATSWIAHDCNRLLRMMKTPLPVLRYENRFFEQPGMVAALAKHLGVAAGAERLDEIFERYRTENVREFAQRLDGLPPERLDMVQQFKMDKVTQILAPHIGDGMTGKFRTLPAPDQARLTEIFGPFLQAFKYEK